MAELFTTGYALLIGVGGNLPVTVADATALNDLLVDEKHAAYPSEQVKLLVAANAHREAILQAFDRLIEQANNELDATVIVYYSGHGGRIERSGNEAEYYLVPHGYEAARRAETAISGAEFTEKIEAIKARKLLVILDCCHAAGQVKGPEESLIKGPEESFVKSPLPPELLSILDKGSGQVVVASSREDESSYTDAKYSVFTDCLLEALKGKGAVNKDGFARILDVLIYLFKNVPTRAAQALAGAQQHPFLKKAFDVGDNFALCYYAGGDKQVPGEGEPPATQKSLTSLTPLQRRLMEKRFQDLEQTYNFQSEKIRRMSKEMVIQAQVAVKYQLEVQLLDEEALLARFQKEMEDLDQLLH